MALASTPAQDRVSLDRAAYTGEPTARMKKAAALLSGGASVEAAMEEAGYGRLYIAGSAKTFPGVLVAAGLIDEKKAAKVTPAAEPAKAPAKREVETIR